MKKVTILLASLAVVAGGVPAVAIAAPNAAPYAAPYQWQNINARQARIEARINQGVRTGALSRREATRLRIEFNSLARLEAQYRRSRPGLTQVERRDLDRRFDVLERKIRIERNDRNNRRGPNRR